MNTETIAKRMAWLACCALTAVVCAMPTKQQLVQAQQLVNDLTADDLRALKSKEKTPRDVAAAHLALADKADTEAGKYLLLQGAFRLYARSGDYDAAAATLQRMRGEIAGLPPELIVEIVNNEMRRVAASKAPKVLAIFRDAQRMIKYRKQLASADLDATAHPENVRYQRRVAECHACLGDWQKALPIFAKLGDVAAKWEFGTAKDCDAAKAADFWWNYKAADVEPFKAHAASLYRAALDANQVSGLRREVAAKRLAEFEASGMPIPAAATGAPASASAVSAGAQKAPAPTTGPWAIPTNFKAPLVRTLKLADGVDMDFCAVPAGTFQMSYPWQSEKANQGKTHKVTITRPFWFSKTFVTTKQYRLFKSVPPERDTVCKDLEAKFPDFDVVHGVAGGNVDSCIEHINQKFGHLLPKGYVFRLPTEAEWEYAYGGGNGKGTKDMGQFKTREETSKILGKYDLKGNHGCRLISGTPANRWGIIGGPTDEPQPVLDRIDGRDGVTESHSTWEHYDYDEHEIDPIRIGKSRIERRGARDRWMHPNAGGLFRVVIGPDLVAEKKGIAKTATNPAPVLAPPVVHQAQNITPPAKIKTHTIKLNNTVSMEFVECPAGSFTMGFEKDEHSPMREHKVTITRPFWMARTKLTLAQYKVFDRKFKPKDEKVLGGDAVPFVVRFFEGWPIPFLEQTEKYCEYLTKKFRGVIPRGYVFRLPTEAEWEYAYIAGETNPDNFYGATGDLGRQWTEAQLREYMFTSAALNEIAMKLGKKEMAGWDRTGTTVGQLKPNRWGLYDMAGNTFETMLDTIDRNLCDSGKAWPPWGKRQTALLYEDDEIDPVKIASPDVKEDKRVHLIRGGDLGKWAKRHGLICSGVRIVVGPDLVAEKKAGKAGKAAVGGDVGAAGFRPSATDTAVKEHEIELKTGIKMVFVECPAGTFMAGRTSAPREGNKNDLENYRLAMHRQVTITRPFWIGKYRVTREEWGVFRPQDVKKMNELEKAIGGQKAPFYGMSYDDAMKYCAFLTKNHKSKIPRGYVFRLPTNAEWEYALRANATDRPDNPYGNADGHPPKGADIKAEADDALRNELKEKGFKFASDGKCILGKDLYDVPPPAAGRKIPNAWGLYDMLGRRQFMLDTVKNKNDAQWEAVDTDPLLVYDGKNRKALCRGSIWWTWMVTFSAPTDETMGVDPKVLRIVVGPDLIAEKKKAGRK